MFEIVQADSAAAWTFRHPIKLVWTDPPFGTDKPQRQRGRSFTDLSPKEARRVAVAAVENLRPWLAPDAVVCVLADDRIIHGVVADLSESLHHQGDIIWSFGLGKPRLSWWPRRHNTIATFTVTPNLPPFDATAVPRESRKAPKPGYPADKPAGSVWDYTMSNTDSERVGYPNQKPVAVVEPFVLAHTEPGDVVADPFAGSGTVGAAALRHGRRFVGQDTSAEAVAVTRRRLDGEAFQAALDFAVE